MVPSPLSAKGLLSLGLTALVLVSCAEPPSPGEPLYLLAAEALGPEAHQGRQKVINPIRISLDNPRFPDRILEEFVDHGYEMLGPDGEEDPEKATYYFTVIRPLENDRYQLRVHVSMGSRFGSMDRGDTWWIVTGSCTEVCRVLEVEPADNRGWRG